MCYNNQQPHVLVAQHNRVYFSRTFTSLWVWQPSGTADFRCGNRGSSCFNLVAPPPPHEAFSVMP